MCEFEGYGKRKSCLVEAKIKKGSGIVKINGKNVIDYFYHPHYRRLALKVVEVSGLSCYLDIDIKV